MNQAIDFVAAQASVMMVDGVEVLVSPLRVKQLPALVRHIEPLLAVLINDAGVLDKARMIALLGDHGEAIIAATAICIGQPKAWVEELLPDRLAVLALLAVEVNANFFTQALPALQVALPQLAPGLLQKINKVPASSPGQTPLTN